MTMIRRSEPASGTLSNYIIKIARLGGYMARARDLAAGNTVMWRGLAHLNDITIGVALSREIVGNGPGRAFDYPQVFDELYAL